MPIHLKIPVENGVEIILCDFFVRCDVRILPMVPPDSITAKIALDAFETRCRSLSHELAAKISDELQLYIEAMKGE